MLTTVSSHSEWTLDGRSAFNPLRDRSAMGPLSGADDWSASIVGGSRVNGAKAMTSAVSNTSASNPRLDLLDVLSDGDRLDRGGVPGHALEHRGDRLRECLLTLEAFVESLADLGDGVLERVEACGDIGSRACGGNARERGDAVGALALDE